MIKFNAVDLISIQECMEGYKKLVEHFPAIGEEEESLKEARLHLIDYLIDKSENILGEYKNNG